METSSATNATSETSETNATSETSETNATSETSATSATSETAINFDSNIFHAVLCHRCGTKIYPAQQMEAHLDRHVIKDMFLEGELKNLQYSMGRMR